MVRLGRAFALDDYTGEVETIGPKIAQDVRKFLNTNKLPMRLSEFHLVDTQLAVAVDVVRGFDLQRGGVLMPEFLQDFLQIVL